jgi:hypothetical protein
MEQLFNWMKGADNLLLIIIFIVVGYVITYPFRAIVRIYRLKMRRRMVEKHGWPPPHLDADGNFKEEEETDEE